MLHTNVLGQPRLAPPTAARRQHACSRIAAPHPHSQARGCRASVAAWRRAARRSSMACKAADAAAAEPAATEAPAINRPTLVTEAWRKVLDIEAAGEVVTTSIDEVNRGGVIVTVEGIKGFIPFSRLDPTRVADSARTDNPVLDEARRAAMVGQTVKAKVIQVDVPGRQLVLSERAANLADLSKTLKKGDIVDGVVRKLADYGAFVSIKGADGELHGTDALIHKSELSWDMVMRPEQVVAVGDDVRAYVMSVDPAKARVGLSLKRMQTDPLKETLDAVLPVVPEGTEALGTVPINVPQSIEEVASELGKEEGITGISMGRQVEERRTVAQDLEIYISRKKVEGGYALVARAGRVVQEVVVTTELDPAGLKAAMQRALKRLV